jgi:hypothetical protein
MHPNGCHDVHIFCFLWMFMQEARHLVPPMFVLCIDLLFQASLLGKTVFG